MNEIMALPMLVRRRNSNHSPTNAYKFSTFQTPYLYHQHHRQSKSPIHDRPIQESIKRPRNLPPLKQSQNFNFIDARIQQKYDEIKALYKKPPKT
jgi:hypothetical protein